MERRLWFRTKKLCARAEACFRAGLFTSKLPAPGAITKIDVSAPKTSDALLLLKKEAGTDGNHRLAFTR